MSDIVKTSSSYSVEIPVDAIIALSKEYKDERETLLSQLELVNGVDDIEYDLYFGPFVCFRIEAEYDTEGMRAKILQIIQKKLEELRRTV